MYKRSLIDLFHGRLGYEEFTAMGPLSTRFSFQGLTRRSQSQPQPATACKPLTAKWIGICPNIVLY
jgi:hypothetical protein